MSIAVISNNGVSNFQETVGKSDTEQKPFHLEESKDTDEEIQKKSGEVPEEFAGMSLMELLKCSDSKKNQIPVVNQIVSAKSPEDGEIYRIFITDEKVTCNHADGSNAWEIQVNGAEQSEKVKNFFKEYTPYEWADELYSGDDMGMVTLKDFWMEFLHD